MYNPQNTGHNRSSAGRPPSSSMSPRLSFSTDFVDHHIRAAAYREAPVSSDFEFTVGNESMMSGADELIFKGRLLPLKEGDSSFPKTAAAATTGTLRDELLNSEGNNGGEERRFSFQPPKKPTKWKAFLGIGKSGSKKQK